MTNTALAHVDPNAHRNSVSFSLAEIEQIGEYIAQSQLFGAKTKQQAVALCLLAQAEGLHPMHAARDYHIIEGKPSLKADVMLARFQLAGGVVEWEELTDEKVSAYFSHPTACPKPVFIDWDTKRAGAAGLLNKDNWKKYPRAMRRVRVISEGIRTAYPAVIAGIYTPEEIYDTIEAEGRVVNQSQLPSANQRTAQGQAGKAAQGTTSQATKQQHAAKAPESAQAEPENTASAAPAEVHGIPADQVLTTGRLVRVMLNQGKLIGEGTAEMCYRWRAIDMETGFSNWIWCWHRNQPKEATGRQDPENYGSYVIVELSTQTNEKRDTTTGKLVKKSYYRVKRMLHVDAANPAPTEPEPVDAEFKEIDGDSKEDLDIDLGDLGPAIDDSDNPLKSGEPST